MTVLTINDVYQYAGAVHGGFPRVATKIQQLLAQYPDAVVSINGDFLGGSQLAESSQGSCGIRVAEALGTQFAVVGNHEFDFGPDRLAELVASSKFKWLGSNIKLKQSNGEYTLFPGLVDFHVESRKNAYGQEIRLGWFGVCTQETVFTSFPGEQVVFEDCIECAKRIVQHLIQIEKCDVLIALTHLSLEQDKKLAADVPEINLILGGHDHEPFALFQDSTLILKSGQNGYWVGMVNLQISWETNSAENFCMIYPSFRMESTFNVVENIEMKKLIQEMEDEFISKATMGNGQTYVNLDESLLLVSGYPFDCRTQSVRTKSTNSAQWIADVFRSTLHCDIGILNGGFIRGDKLYSKGAWLTLRDFEAEFPFPKSAVALEMTESDLWIAMEQMLSRTPVAIGSFPHISSGCFIEYDTQSEPLQRIKKFVINGKSLRKDGQSSFLVATTAFVALGGDGCTSFSKAKLLETHPLVVKDMLIEHCRNLTDKNLIADVEPRVCEVTVSKSQKAKRQRTE